MPSKKTVVKKSESKKKPAKPVAKKTVAKKPVAKTAAKAKPKPKAAPIAKSVNPAKKVKEVIESSLLVQGTKFLKVPFFFDVEKEPGAIKYFAGQKQPEKPTASSRPRVTGSLDSKNLVEILSQQLENENKNYFDGCEGQICVKCNIGVVDPKFYVDKSLGYCTDCATLLGLGQSKEGVFSDAQMELMRRSMEKSMEGAKDIDEDDIESALGEMDNLELEEALLAVVEEEEVAELDA
jgi:hypothetical protein